jgi:hypothetical protein
MEGYSERAIEFVMKEKRTESRWKVD